MTEFHAILYHKIHGKMWPHSQLLHYMCRTPCTLDMCYRLIPLYGSNIINPSILIKPRLRVRFGSTIMKYAFTSPPPKVEMEGKEMHGQMFVHTDIQSL